MIFADQLLAVAEQLAKPPAKGKPRQANLRRAISTAYYAFFHRLVAGATDLLTSQKSRGGKRYLAIYRSFEHTQMAKVCRQITAGTLRNNGDDIFDPSILGCAAAFVELQKDRHEADYDPTKRIALSDAIAAVSRAREAIRMLEGSPEDERSLFLTLLLVRPRA